MTRFTMFLIRARHIAETFMTVSIGFFAVVAAIAILYHMIFK